MQKSWVFLSWWSVSLHFGGESHAECHGKAHESLFENGHLQMVEDELAAAFVHHKFSVSQGTKVC